jgi:lipoprotein-anchoring transpeptidase ErfK/SrfK
MAKKSHKIISELRAPKVQIYIDRDNYWLYHYQRRGNNPRFKVTRFPIAVGAIGDATPAGAYYIDAKTRTPDWLIPKHEDYDPTLWGTIVPFSDPKNPFFGGFLSLSDEGGVGIHGTRFNPMVGTRASHGCIRVRSEDIEFIYKHSPLGSPVIIR